MAAFFNKEKMKAKLRGVLNKLCHLQDDPTMPPEEDELSYDEWKEKKDNAERQKRFRDKWKKDCKVGTTGDKPNPKKPTDINKTPLPKKKVTKKKSPYG